MLRYFHYVKCAQIVLRIYMFFQFVLFLKYLVARTYHFNSGRSFWSPSGFNEWANFRPFKLQIIELMSLEIHFRYFEMRAMFLGFQVQKSRKSKLKQKILFIESPVQLKTFRKLTRKRQIDRFYLKLEQSTNGKCIFPLFFALAPTLF